jgi:hypothetical protein
MHPETSTNRSRSRRHLAMSFAFDVVVNGVMRGEAAGNDWRGTVRPRLPLRTELPGRTASDGF